MPIAALARSPEKELGKRNGHGGRSGGKGGEEDGGRGVMSRVTCATELKAEGEKEKKETGTQESAMALQARAKKAFFACLPLKLLFPSLSLLPSFPSPVGEERQRSSKGSAGRGAAQEEAWQTEGQQEQEAEVEAEVEAEEEDFGFGLEEERKTAEMTAKSIGKQGHWRYRGGKEGVAVAEEERRERKERRKLAKCVKEIVCDYFRRRLCLDVGAATEFMAQVSAP